MREESTERSRGVAGGYAKTNGLMYRMHRGNGAFDIVGKRRRFFVAFGVLLLVCVLSLALRGFNFGIEFTGGTQIHFPAQGAKGAITVSEAGNAFQDALGHKADAVQSVGTGAATTIQIRTDHLTTAQAAKVEKTLFHELRPLASNGQPSQGVISDSAVSATWGGEVSQGAIVGLIVFLVLVSVFLSLYFERWMALAALLALLNDVVVTAGIYSLVGFEVTPPTVIGLLTILGFSLYDTVVVFDKVKENTRGLLGLSRRSYPEAANLALNETLMRSINTSLIGLLPVIGLLIVGLGILGVGTLADLSLVQLIGLVAGCSSSLFLATPLLVTFKMRQQAYRKQAARVRNRRAATAKRKAAAAASTDAASSPESESRRRDAPGPQATGSSEEPDETDDDLDADLRHEQALAAASSVPARTRKKSDQQRSSGPGGKSGSRPSGKRNRR
jgi:preprotein translocase subunit SecF